MLWVTRKHPHLDRCACIWLITRFVDVSADFDFIEKDEKPPKDSQPFVLPGAELNPVEGASTAFDAVVKKFGVTDPVALEVGKRVHDFEVDAGEDIKKTRFPETAGLYKIVRGLTRVTDSDKDVVVGALVVFDSLYAQLSDESGKDAAFALR